MPTLGKDNHRLTSIMLDLYAFHRYLLFKNISVGRVLTFLAYEVILFYNHVISWLIYLALV